MKIHEYQAKNLFSAYNIPIEEYILCNTPAEALKVYKHLGKTKVVVKAQVHTGGRGKAGGVKLVNNEKELLKEATSILNLKINNFPVEKIIISEAVDIKSEYYVCFAIDRNTKSVILIMSKEGGIDIEEVAKTSPQKISRHSIDPALGIPDFLARKFSWELFDKLEHVNQVSSILQNLYKLFIDTDASLAEINPLVLTAEGKISAIDAKMTFDANSMYRQPNIQALLELTEEEKIEAHAKEQGFSYVHLDGSIGCMVNGAGLAMATMDMIKLYGGSPANFLDIGGSSNPQKIVDAIKLLLKDSQVKVVLINIFGGITRCDDVASGLLTAFKQLNTDIPIVVRLTGTNDKEGRKMLQGTQIKVAETMGDAVRLAIESQNI